ncbi:MAG: polyphosphate kinase [Thermomicrobiales bacterium]|nr:polyphosphate kinase [Thermomicrobiales bacterium]
MTNKRKGHRSAAAAQVVPATQDGRAGPARLQPVTPTEGAPPLSLPPLLPELYINRELSWLAFNRRVLEEAADPTAPLLERVKFAAIFASNLDEFFMIRVAGLKRKLAAGIGDPGPDGRTPSAQFAAVRAATQDLLDEQSALLRHQLLPELAAAGVELVRYDQLTATEQSALAEYFDRDIFPVLTPQAIDRARRFPHVSNQSLNLIVVLRSEAAGQRFARVKVPAVLPRLVRLRGAGSDGGDSSGHSIRFIWLEDLTIAHLGRLFAGNEIAAAYPFHVTRDSDIEVDDDDQDESSDLLVAMRELLSERTFGSVVKLTVDRGMPEEVRGWLVEQLHASERDLYLVDGPLAPEDLMELTRIDRPDLKDPAFVPAGIGPSLGVPPLLAEATTWGIADVFGLLRERDVLVHHPYQSFGVVTDFLRAAATDPNVVAIKQTLYRLGRDSPLIPALIEARDDDTQVAVLVELKARFDEENNITWAQQLEQHGVHVAYGVAGLKTHCKATLVVRREPEGLRRYVHLATGNYNASTARTYEDIGLLTAREDLASDVSELFNVLTGYSQQDQYRKLWVAPAHLRERFLEAIAREIEAHRRTGDGYLVFKMNALVDRELIRALYAASQAGVRIDLIIRGVCCLRPGVPGWSETIRVRSIVGRFLEHSRIYYFRHGGEDLLYLGSADLMERNLDRRVEAVFPIEDPTLKAHVRDLILPAYLRDTVNARELRPDGSYVPARPADGQEPFDVQRWMMGLYTDVRPAVVGESTAPR